MSRVKRGVIKNKRRKNTLFQTKGYRLNRRNKEAAAIDAIMHAGANAFEGRRDKKGEFRRLWNVRLNAALRENGHTYSKFIGALKKVSIELDRKVLSEIASANPESFKRIVAKAK
ncbi:MAG: 50S ribosomal protein L20 [Patescibacteria group bacterium]|nr:50S ribosomal protein L20 [Patescibacteria group bacterium]